MANSRARTLVVLLAGLAAVAATAAPVAARPATEADSALTSTLTGAKVTNSRLSPRLEELVATTLARRSSAEQNRALSLSDSGAGSLLRAPDGRLVVEARLDSDAASVFAALEATGATVISRAIPEKLVALRVPIARLRDVAAVPGVAWVGEVLTPMVGRSGGAAAGRSASTDAGTSAACSSRLISEGDAQLRAVQARSSYSVDGAGVKVGVLSDSYGSISGGPASDVANGELPGAGNPCGRTTPVEIQSDRSGESDEGRAMAQIVHDLAPGSPIRFASAFNGEVDFANQIRALQANGSKVIVDDIYYFAEPVYQDGVVAKAITDVTNLGAAYFTAAGNQNIIVGGRNVASYEAMAFRPTTCPTGFGSYTCHDFDPGTGTDSDNTIRLANNSNLILKLDWNEPAYGVTTDLDLFVVDTSGNIVAQAQDTNPTGSKRPVEVLSFRNTTGSAANYRIVVGRWGATGTPRFKTIIISGNISSVEYDTNLGSDVVGPTIFGHSASKDGANVAAVPYSSASQIESFSSWGPGVSCYGPIVGTSPAAPLPGGCETRRLTVAATDGVRNSFFGGFQGGYYRFYGTSAAAPHAAAVGALQRQARSCATGRQVLAAQMSSASAVGSYGVNAVGSGLVTADAAIAAMAPCGLTPPGAPAGAYAIAGTNFAEVRWGPAADNGSPITQYTVTPYVGGVPGTPKVFSAGSTSGTLTGLASGTPYTFRVSATNAGGTGPQTADTNTVTPSPAAEGTVYVPITPCRVLDTRSASAGALGSGEQRAVQVAGPAIAGQGGRPSCIPDGAAAAEVSISALAGAGTGYLRAWPNGQPMPTATFLNYSNSAATTNTGAVPLAASGKYDLLLRNMGGPRGVVIDVQGYYVRPIEAPAGSVYVPITPCRVLDTRNAGGALVSGTTRDIQVAGPGITGQGAKPSCVPDGVTAVEASVSAVAPSGAGYVRAWPRGQAQPTATFLNYTNGKGTTNTGAVTLAATGKLDLSVFNAGGMTHLVVDIQGYFKPITQAMPGDGASLYVPITPCRILDTRTTSGALTAGTVTDYQIAGGIVSGQGGLAGCIRDGSSGAEVTVSAVSPVGSGYTRAWPAGVPQPTATFLNYANAESTTNTGSVSLAPTGLKDLSFGNFAGRANYVIDIQGYWVSLVE